MKKNADKEKLLSQEKLQMLLDYNSATGLFKWKVSKKGIASGSVAGSVDDKGYIRITINKNRFLAHRLAWFYHYGFWPKENLDHINRTRNDNRIKNLREVTIQQNHFNKGPHDGNISGIVGVNWSKDRQKWQARIQVNGKQIYLGRFSTKQDAHAAYVIAWPHGRRPGKETAMANARLIAAAPEMLDALKLVVDTFENGGWPPATIVIAKAALAKAEGNYEYE